MASLEFLVGVAAMRVATIGVGLPASWRMVSLGSSALNLESYV